MIERQEQLLERKREIFREWMKNHPKPLDPSLKNEIKSIDSELIGILLGIEEEKKNLANQNKKDS